MRLSSQNNQFIVNLPQDIIPKYMVEEFDKLMVKNFIPYDSAVDYISSTIKQITFPGASFDVSEQTLKRGKKFRWKESGNIYDKFTSELDIQFRSVDSWLNYYMLLEILSDFYLDNSKHHIPLLILQILDKDGDLIYTVVFREIIFRSISEVPLNYNAQDVTEQTFTVMFNFNWVDVYWELSDDNNGIKKSRNIFDIPINWVAGPLDKKFGNIAYPNLKVTLK